MARMIPLYDTHPGSRFPAATLLLILLNVAIFAGWQLRVGMAASVEKAAMVPAQVMETPLEFATVVSSQFLHGNWLHLVGNMWFLLIFGNNVEDRLGRIPFVVFYILCGCGAALAYVYFNRGSTTPMVGASGAVSGLLGAYLACWPRARIATLLPLGIFSRIIEIPAAVYLLVWIGLQVIAHTWGTSRGTPSNVAYLAHIGGFVAGICLVPLFPNSHRKKAVHHAR